jgi:ATP-dependent Clp protease ATP-binding subunit ClpC
MEPTSNQFSPRMQSVLALAQDAAARFDHEYVGTEHVLLGLLEEDQGIAAAVLDELQADRAGIRAKIESTISKGRGAPTVSGSKRPLTSRTKTAFDLAAREARQLGDSEVSTEHVLLGLLGEGRCIAAQVLMDSGVEPAAARWVTMRLRGKGEAPPGEPE